MHPMKCTILLLGLVQMFTCARMANAQAEVAAQRDRQLGVFGTFALTRPDYYQPSNLGGTVGGDFFFARLRFGQPAVVFRYSKVVGPTVTETFLGGGLELLYPLRVWRPYATLAYGLGGLTVPMNHYSDSGYTILAGGGVDVLLNRRFSLRGEFTESFLHISGQNGTSKGELKLNPSSINIGLAYRIK